MSKFGMIVRADMGGLGNLTKSLWRHLQPDETLVVHLPDPRGKDDTNFYMQEHRPFSARHPITTRMFRQLCRAIGRGGTLLTVETMYCDDAYRIAREEGVRTILYAMPELYAGDPADVIVVPTPWELNRMPVGTKVMAMPTEHAPRLRIRDECKTFLHHVAPAMLDRSGTDVVLKALQLMEETCKMIFHDPNVLLDRQWFALERVKERHELFLDHRWHDNLWDSYPLEADMMVLPRRYGGLSMPTQEAAATGQPSIMPALPPQTFWGGVEATALTTHATRTRMKGGSFYVHEPDPIHLAAVMDAHARGERDIAGLSRDAAQWAAAISWPNMIDEWRELCRG